VQDRQVDGSSVRARAHLPSPPACFLQRGPRSPSAFDAGIHSRSSTALTGCSGPDRSPSERLPGLRSSPGAPRREVPGFGAVGSPVRLGCGTVAPVRPRVSARQPEPTAGWRDCPRLGSLLAANQWIAEMSAVVEPILRRPSPHSLPIESLLLPETKATPISSGGEKMWGPGKGQGGLDGDSGPGPDRRARSTASQRRGQSPGGRRGEMPAPTFLNAEEVRGSNPLAPTSKGPGHRAFFYLRGSADRWFEAPEVDEKLTRQAGDVLPAIAGVSGRVTGEGYGPTPCRAELETEGEGRQPVCGGWQPPPKWPATSRSP
jgi:hypothetical protein